jgi:glycolate oxidase FAD binding subunit
MRSPTTRDELRDVIADAMHAGRHLEIRGGGSKANIGAAREATILDMRGFRGVIDYDPHELILTVRAGTPLAEIETLVATENQMLAFEPWDHGVLFGDSTGAATIGGIVAAGVSGSRRLTLSAARDHFLGFEAVSGRAEHFVAGGQVVKNVTGYDLPKLMAGSWGRLAALTQLTLKVLPRPRICVTMIMEGLDVEEAHAVMACAMASNAEVSAAAHVPARVNDGRAVTALRLQGFEPSVQARCRRLPDLLRSHGALRRLGEPEADAFWDAVRQVAPLADGRPLWRAHVPPSSACGVVAVLESLGARWLIDWAGGLVWLSFDGDPGILRQTAEDAGGYATLVRAPAELRAVVPMQHPRPRGVMALEARVRRAFDPFGVFESGRFLDHNDAN